MKTTGRFRAQFRAFHENQCEVCEVRHNYRRGEPVAMAMDMAHLVAKSELATFVPYGNVFNRYGGNFALLCQKCHAAFDCWLGVMGKSAKAKITQRFEQYIERFTVLLRRRDLLLRTLMALSEDPRPDASNAVKGGSLLNNHPTTDTLSPIVRTSAEAITPAPRRPDSTTSEQTPARGSCPQPVEGNEGFSSEARRAESCFSQERE